MYMYITRIFGNRILNLGLYDTILLNIYCEFVIMRTSLSFQTYHFCAIPCLYKSFCFSSRLVYIAFGIYTCNLKPFYAIRATTTTTKTNPRHKIYNLL